MLPRQAGVVKGMGPSLTGFCLKLWAAAGRTRFQCSRMSLSLEGEKALHTILSKVWQPVWRTMLPALQPVERVHVGLSCGCPTKKYYNSRIWRFSWPTVARHFWLDCSNASPQC